MKPATSSCRAFCAASTHGRWPRPRALGPTRPAVQNCGLRGGETAGDGWSQPPPGGLANEARNVQLPGVLCGFHPRTVAAAEGIGPRHGRPLKIGAFGCETARGGWSQPPPGGLANEARNVQLPGVLCGFHPRTLDAAEGIGPRHGRPLETAGGTRLLSFWRRCRGVRGVGSEAAGSSKLRPSRRRNRRGRLVAAPARGLCKRSPQLLVAGRSVRLPPTDAGRGQGRWGLGRPAVQNCGLHLPNRLRRFPPAPAGGFADEARNFQLPGVLCGFHPRTLDAAGGQCGSGRPAVQNCGLRGGETAGGGWWNLAK